MASPFYTKLHTNQNAAALCVTFERRKTIKYLLLLLSILVITSCAQFKATDRSRVSDNDRLLMLGEWCGARITDDGENLEWKVTRKLDGSYSIQFSKHTKDGDVAEWEEYGIWGIRYPVYFSVVQFVLHNGRRIDLDPNLSKYYDVYIVETLNESKLQYKSLASGKTHLVKKDCKEM